MNIERCEDLNTWSRAISKWTEDNAIDLRAKGLSSLNIFVPAGLTPVPIYEVWEKNQPTFLKTAELHQIDDVATGAKRGVFRDFFKEHLPSFQNQMRWIDLAEATPDLCILGLGLNGHVAFHEPELPLDFVSGCVRLSSKTCETLELEKQAWGITYGLGSFLKAKSIVLIVQGKGKKQILERVLGREKGLPAAELLNHPSLKIIADVAAF
jgi:6-phosphogluconolactonase/glucosamine-6-phosphate isomerase/deaminase